MLLLFINIIKIFINKHRKNNNKKTIFNIMFTLTCSNYEKKFKNNNDFNRYVTHCRVRRSVQRCILRHDDLDDSMMIDDEYNNDDVNINMN